MNQFNNQFNNQNKNQHNNQNPPPDTDATGDIISWVLTIILLFAFPPVGILLLYLKMRSSAKPAQDSVRWAEARNAGAARVDAKRAEWQHSAASQQNASYQYASYQNNSQQYNSQQYASHQNTSQQNTSRQNASHQNTSQQNASYQNLPNIEAVARKAAQEAGEAARLVAKEAGTVARKAAKELESAARQFTSGYSGGYVHKPSQTQANYTYNYSATQKPKKDKKKKRSKLDKKSGKFLSVVLLLVSITMFIFSITWLATAAQAYSGAGQMDWFNLFMGISTFVGAIATFFSRNIGAKRISRYKNYYAFAAGRDIVPLTDIALASGLSVRAVTRDIQAMINAGYFEFGAYIDSELDSLVLRAEAAEELRRAARAEAEEPAPSYNIPESQYMQILAELRELNYSIADVTISGKVDRIEELTGKIFKIVEEYPEKKPQIRRFMSYYLPTTFKLLRSYSTLEKQGVKGENIMAAKENIGRILDTLATGFEQQLDQLFQSDAIDIAADINVLENLMQQDGLASDKSEFRTMAEGSS